MPQLDWKIIPQQPSSTLVLLNFFLSQGHTQNPMNYWLFSVVNYFCRSFHFRCLTGLSIDLWLVHWERTWQTFSRMWADFILQFKYSLFFELISHFQSYQKHKQFGSLPGQCSFYMQIAVYQYNNKTFWTNFVYSSKEISTNRVQWHPSNFTFKGSRDVIGKSTKIIWRIKKVFRYFVRTNLSHFSASSERQKSYFKIF